MEFPGKLFLIHKRFEDGPFSPGQRFNLKNNLRTVFLAGNKTVKTFGVGIFFTDRFPVCYLGITDSGIDLEIFKNAGHENIQVQFSHSRNKQLAGIRILTDRKGGIFPLKLVENLLEFFLIAGSLGFNGNGNNRFGKLHRFERYLVSFGTDGVACLGNLKTDYNGYVPGFH